jgi:hypothetical protein
LLSRKISRRQSRGAALLGATPIACYVLWAALGGFIVSMSTAAHFYPGGTWFDRSHDGHDFWYNFWCDLLRKSGLNGRPNLVAPKFATAGMLSLSTAAAMFWLLVPRLFPDRERFAVWIRALGLASSIGAGAIVLAPSDRLQFLHGVLVTVTGPAGIGAGLLSIIGCWAARDCPRSVPIAGTLVISVALANLVQYARQFWFDAADSPLLPALQKAATLAFIVWMGLVTLVVTRRARRAAAGASPSGLRPPPAAGE